MIPYKPTHASPSARIPNTARSPTIIFELKSTWSINLPPVRVSSVKISGSMARISRCTPVRTACGSHIHYHRVREILAERQVDARLGIFTERLVIRGFDDADHLPVKIV